MIIMNQLEDICLETREDLIRLLQNNQYDYIMIKFWANWCKPCKVIKPFVEEMLEKKFNDLDNKERKNAFLYIDANVDECCDLYAFLKQKKRINGIPAIFLYSKKIIETMEPEHIYIPHASVSGSNTSGIKKLFDCII